MAGPPVVGGGGKEKYGGGRGQGLRWKKMTSQQKGKTRGSTGKVLKKGLWKEKCRRGTKFGARFEKEERIEPTEGGPKRDRATRFKRFKKGREEEKGKKRETGEYQRHLKTCTLITCYRKGVEEKKKRRQRQRKITVQTVSND